LDRDHPSKVIYRADDTTPDAAAKLARDTVVRLEPVVKESVGCAEMEAVSETSAGVLGPSSTADHLVF